MGRISCLFVVVQCLLFFARTLGEIDVHQRDKYLKALTEHLNNFFDQNYFYEDGVLVIAQKISDDTYFIQINIKQKEHQDRSNFKHLTCTANVRELPNGEISVPENNVQCIDGIVQQQVPSTVGSINDESENTSGGITSTETVQHTVQLVNELQPGNKDVSGEYINIPRVSSTCFGCGSHVDPSAPGVQDLAFLAVRHLDIHEPSVKHTLTNVLDVERQVQVVNGVRFILTLNVSFDKCAVMPAGECQSIRTCKVSILEKPWVRLADGSKFRSIVSNNCTNQWLFGDNGEVLPTIFENAQENRGNNDVIINPTDSFQNSESEGTSNGPIAISDEVVNGYVTSDVLREVHETGLQAQLPQRTLTEKQIRELEEQIIPAHDTVSYPSYETLTRVQLTERRPLIHHNINNPSNQHEDREVPEGTRPCFISDDKKQAVDDLLKYFNFGGDILPTLYFSSQRNFRSKRYGDEIARIPLSVNVQKKSFIDSFASKSTKNVNPPETLRNDQSITNSDVIKERKRRFISGLKEEDAHDKHYRDLAELSLQRYHADADVQYLHKIVDIVKVTKQVVSGIITHIYFTISPTECLKSEVSSRSHVNCEIEDSSNVRNCHSKIYSSPNGNNEITVTCGSLGQKIRKTRRNTSKYYLKKSDVTVHVPLLSNDFKVLNKNDVDLPEVVSKKVSRSSRSLVGDPQHQVLNDQYRNLAIESLKKYHENSNVQYIHQIVEIIDVTKQIVSGTITKINFIISPTGCIKNLTNESSQMKCEIQNNNNIRHCHSEIYEKPELGSNKDINVGCSSLKKDTPKKRHSDTKFKRNVALPGGVQVQNPNESSYMRLAVESLQKYQLLSNTPYIHTVLKIDHVTTQIVSGVLTKLDFQVTPTHCLVNDLPISDINNCQIQDENVVLNCHSEVWDRPWMKQGKQINVTCQDQNIINDNRKKRNNYGGIEDNDSNNNVYKEMAYQSLQEYESFSSNELFHKITHVTKVTTQVVAGTLTRIDFTVAPTDCLKIATTASDFNAVDCNVLNDSDEYDCHVEVWERPWLKDEKEKIQREIKCELNNSLLRKKRNLGGGVRKQDQNEQIYRDLAQRSLQKYQLLSSNQAAHKLITVDHVTVQVVAGTLTRIDFTISPTSCSKNDVPGEVGENCELRNDILKCFAKVWSRPWLKDENETEQIDVNCASKESDLSRKKRSSEISSGSSSDRNTHVPGGDREHDSNDDKYKEMARESLSQYQSFSNNEYYHMVTQVHKVTTQILQGIITRIDFTAAPTNCLRNDIASINFHLNKCEAQSAANTYECHVEIWDRPWLQAEKDKRQTEISCVPQENEAKRMKLDFLPGGLKEEEPNNEKYINMAQRSLHKYQLLSSNQAAHKLITVDHVTVQVVAGTLTRIDFTISPTSCSKNDVPGEEGANCELRNDILKCFAKVWSRPWLKDENEKEQIDVNCADSESKLLRSKSSSLATIADDILVYELVQESLRKLELTSVDRYKLRLVKLTNYSTKIDAGKVFTINFDAAYTSCSKYEIDRDDATCPYLESLPKKHCVAEIRERLTGNGNKIDVNCHIEGTPPLSHPDLETKEVNVLANIALKFIEAKYPHPRKQKIVRIVKWEKELIADTHYRMKIEVGYTNCSVFSVERYCDIIEDMGINRFCHVNVWVRAQSDLGPKVRVSCNQDGDMRDLFLQIQAEYLFSDFVVTHKPRYLNDTNETRRRFGIFKENVKKIHALNVYERGTATYGVTKFADLTYDEFRKKHTGLNTSLYNPNEIPMAHARIPDIDLPTSFDWREKDAVTPVKNQGSCGSCWAFSVTGNIEGQWKLKTGNLVSLSEQELVDCDKLDEGCNGGLPDNAYRAIEQLGGLETEDEYPYEGEDEKCAFNKSLSKVTVRGAVNITKNETGMAKWLVKNGPISIGINANAMQFYMGGISHPWKMLCNPDNLDHGVLIVGYGVKDYPLFKKHLPYWIIKNSWGAQWGEQGYYRTYRGDGTCGLNLMASSALV